MFIRMNTAADQGKLLPFSTWHSEAVHGILHLVLGCQVQKILEETGEGPANSCSDAQGLENTPYEMKVKVPGLFHLANRRSREDPTAPYNHLKESKIREPNFLQEKNSALRRRMKHWKVLLGVAVKSPSLVVFNSSKATADLI